MGGYISNIYSIFENEENVQDAEMSIEEIIDKIKSNINLDGITIDSDGNNIIVNLSSGYKFKLNENALKFYQQIFGENVQKEQTFDKYLPEIDNLLGMNEVTDITQKMNRIKIMKAELGVAEENPDKYSVLYRIINSDDECDVKINLFNAYSNNSVENLSEDELNKLNSYLNDYLNYYKFLFNVFNLFG